MDAFAGMYKAQAAAARGDPGRVFDWTKAATLIKERQPRVAEAGLIEDWGWTAGDIYRDGVPVSKDDTYTYLSSLWATPTLILDGESIPCFVAGDETEWDSDTYWPAEALAILTG